MLYPNFNHLIALKNKVKSLHLLSDKAVTSTTAGDYKSPFRGQGLEFEEVREYAPGDDIRSIDWRVTARTGKPYTKVFTEERERRVIICVDMNAEMRFGTRGTFKSVQAATIAGLLGWKANLNRDRLSLYLFGDVPDGKQFFASKRTRNSLWAAFKHISNQDISERSQPVLLEEVLKDLNKVAATGSLIYILSDFSQLTQGLEKQLSLLQKRCSVVLIAVDDPADKNIPPVGSLLFSRSAHSKSLINTDTASGRESYAREWLEKRQNLQKIATRFNISLINIETDADPQHGLAKGLSRIGNKRGRR